MKNSVRRISAALLAALALSACVVRAGQKSDFDLAPLSPKGREAYQKLLRAEVFRVGSVGYSGETSEEELALYDLLEEKESVAALKRLVGDGSYEGGLYGLLGLSVKDVKEFNRAVEVYKAREQPHERMAASFMKVSKGKVATQSGCIMLGAGWLKVVGQIQSGRYDKLLGPGVARRN